MKRVHDVMAGASVLARFGWRGILGDVPLYSSAEATRCKGWAAVPHSPAHKELDMPSPTNAELEAIDIPWNKIACIVKAVAKFLWCERNGGQNCAGALAEEIRACFG